MSMNNSSTTNEKLIDRIKLNLEHEPEKPVSVLYHTIINTAFLGSFYHTYSFYEDLTCEDRIQHHGCKKLLVHKKFKFADNNTAKALKVLRKHLPFRLAKYCVMNPDSDLLYFAISS